MKKTKLSMVQLDEVIESKIFLIRGKKVMLDRDLARLYGVDTRRLNEQVRRNIERFPDGFMYQLTKGELTILMSQFATSSWGGIRRLPYVFTDYGIAMLSSVLNSKRAIQVNIQIIRSFIKMREISLSNGELKRKIESMEKKYDHQFQVVFKAIKRLLEPPNPKQTKKIGFHSRLARNFQN